MDIKLDMNPTSQGYGDAVFINGPLTTMGVTTEVKEVVAQRLRIRLLTFQNEWFANTSYGVPYYQRILAKKPTRAAIDQIFQQAILEERGVSEILSYTSSFSNRQYKASFKVRVGSEVTDPITIFL